VTIVDRVTDIVGPLVVAHGCTLYDIEHAGGVVSVLVDRPGGIDLDTISALTREISRALDEDDPIAGRYTLEVSSPGLERRLRTPEHFANAVGEVVTVRTTAEAAGAAEAADERRIRGTLTSAGDGAITLRGEDGGERQFALADIERARTVFEWGPAQKKRANAS
jgi:ribosome maturation factor RimP